LDYRGYVDLLCSTEDCRSELEEVLRVFVELLDDVKGWILAGYLFSQAVLGEGWRVF